MIEKPVPPVALLYGSLRSGTTLLRLILDAHPAITAPGERDFLVDHWTPVGRLDRDGLADDRIFRAAMLDLPDGDDPSVAFRQMLEQERQRATGILVLVMHRGLGRLLDQMPDIPIIHLVRDPRDVAQSSIGMGWAGTTWHGVDHWLETERGFARHASRLGPDQVLMTLRYEDLLADHQGALTRLCAFLGLRFDPAMLGYSDTSTYEPLNPALAQQWRRKQTPQDIGLVEHRVGPMLQSLGYEPSGHPLIAPGRALQARLRARNIAARWRFRFGRYGVVDPVLASVAHWTGRPGIGRGARLRMAKTDIKFLK